MDSLAFLNVVRNFTNLTEEEYRQVSDLSVKHPYSQFLHLILSRAAHDLNQPNASEQLHTSAVYAADRTVLKWVMTVPRLKRVELPPIETPSKSALGPDTDIVAVKASDKPNADPVQHGIVNLTKPAQVTQAASLDRPSFEALQGKVTDLTGDALRADIYLELQKLKESKLKFQASLEMFQNSVYGEKEEKSKSKPSKDTDPLLAEIKSTKKKIKIENPKQKEQNEIIDQFIKAKPVIPKVKPMVPDTDLSEESSIFSDNIVSETLVELLLKQGKKEKAIEVLKKLIWKFPQKKAYFAAQIEELKN